MHRQSLGSPASKLQSHGGIAAIEENVEVDQVTMLTDEDDDDEDDKSQKPHKSASRSESYRFIHFIPILTFLCFLILYLSSHNPSQKDLGQFNGFKRSPKLIDSTEIDDVGQFLEIKKGDVLAIRSLRNLQEIGKHGPANRKHRKIGDF